MTLAMREEYCRGAADESAKVPINNVCSQLRLRHVMWYYTCQGRTIRDRHVVLLDTEHPLFSTGAMVVGLSHATHGKYLHTGDCTSGGDWCASTPSSLYKERRMGSVGSPDDLAVHVSDL